MNDAVDFTLIVPVDTNNCCSAHHAGYPNASQSEWCGKLTVAGNTYAEAAGQGSGCRLDNDASSMCSPYLPPPGVVGRQCGPTEPLLPPPCADAALFDACKAAPGVAGICYSDTVTSTASQGWAKSWFNFTTLIGGSTQTAGPT
jgi:hypothetical protein